MRNLHLLDAMRDVSPSILNFFGSPGDHETGCFFVSSPTGGHQLKVIASAGFGWDHVSVSLPNRCPNWHEMEKVKRLFFKDDETAMQLHVPPSDHLSFHPHCLHLWRPHDVEIPRPPAALVGAPIRETEDAR